MTDSDGGRPPSAGHIHVAAGTGILARRDTALLFVPDSGPGADDLLRAFDGGEAASVVESVTDAATVAGFDVAPFVLVSWNADLHVVVLGAVEVCTDHPSLPMLSGAGSQTWVERRLRLTAAAITVRAGGPASPSTDLQLGRVSAGGFAATFSGGAVGPSPNAATAGRPDPVTTSPPPPPPSPATAADPTGPIASDRLAALRAAMRGPIEPDPPPSPEAATPPETTPIDDEVTLAPEDPPADLGLVDTADHDEAPFVAARRCGRGHLNPPHVGACRMCGDLLDIGAPVDRVRQPPLATLDLGDGNLLPIDRTLVLGRKPDVGAAQATDRARAVPFAGDASVSRTHVRIDVEEWTLTVTDCGSRSGTAIVPRPGEEPRILEPWVSHELPIGARLFLGGPTSVVIRPAGDR